MADVVLTPADPAPVATLPDPAPVATPAEELGLLVAWGAALFYWAEAPENPAVRSYWDALHYIATSLSVGYANIFPVTALGKAVGAVVMMVGPALSARALDAGSGSPAALPAESAVVERLDAILAELRRQPAA